MPQISSNLSISITFLPIATMPGYIIFKHATTSLKISCYHYLQHHHDIVALN